MMDGETIKIDGHMTDGVWARVKPTGDFTQYMPNRANLRLSRQKSESRTTTITFTYLLGCTTLRQTPSLKRNFRQG